MRAEECGIPPVGWRCTRKTGHSGPCAAIEMPEDNYTPDPKMHQTISLAKSGLRLGACVILAWPLYGHIVAAAVLFGLAEILGIIEELV